MTYSKIIEERKEALINIASKDFKSTFTREIMVSFLKNYATTEEIEDYKKFIASLPEQNKNNWFKNRTWFYDYYIRPIKKTKKAKTEKSILNEVLGL